MYTYWCTAWLYHARICSLVCLLMCSNSPCERHTLPAPPFIERGICTMRWRGGFTSSPALPPWRPWQSHGIIGSARSRRLAWQPCGAIVIGSSLARAVEAEVTSKSCGELWSCSCANECLIIFVLSTPSSSMPTCHSRHCWHVVDVSGHSTISYLCSRNIRRIHSP